MWGGEFCQWESWTLRIREVCILYNSLTFPKRERHEFEARTPPPAFSQTKVITKCNNYCDGLQGIKKYSSVTGVTLVQKHFPF